METRVIRKYGNRRLYDTAAKRYVNLEEIAAMIREGSDIRVQDARTGEDLTRAILTQIIVEDTKSRNGGLPLELLRELVRWPDKARTEGLTSYLNSALETYRRAQRAPVDFLRTLFSPPAPINLEELEELRRRVEELERLLAAKPDAAPEGS